MPACTVSVEIPSGGVAEVPDLTGELVATDNRTPRHLLIVEQDPPAGTLVGVGAYIITTTITDQSGNQTTCTNVFCVTAEAGVGPFQNTAQSFTATCPAGTTGTSKTAVIPAGTYTSTTSQADADAQALAAATAQANAALCCCPVGEECPECPECEECPDNVYPYGYGYDVCYDIYDYPNCYPYGYGCYPPPTIPSYVINHWWKMNECGGSSVSRVDSIGTADLTASIVSGTISCTAGIVGNAALATGASVDLQTTSTELIYFNNGLTIFGWCYMNHALGGANNLFMDYELLSGGAADRLRMFLIYPASEANSMSAIIQEQVSGTPTVTGTWPNHGYRQWMFFIITHNGASGSLTLELKTTSPTAHHLIITTPTNWIPAAHNNGRIFFYGGPDNRLFDECGLIYRILTQAEKDFLWNGGAGRSWPFA